MTFRILRIFLICFVIAALLNMANFFVCYYIHVNRIVEEEEEWTEDFERPTTAKWENKLNTLLICDANSSNCPNGHSVTNEIKADSETSEKSNGIYYYMEDGVLSNTRFCPRIPSGLGPVETDDSLIELNAFEEMFGYLKSGGLFKPTQCIPRQSVAVIVPMQNVNSSWKNFIGTFLFYIHLFLMKQLSEYQIFLIIQDGNPKDPYARGKLLNIGFVEAQKMRRNGWDCAVFHDAYYIPTDTRNLYRCTNRPRRLMSTRPNTDTFGGAVALRPSIFKKINGFSNLNWQNDGDYFNMYQRLYYWNYTIETTRSSIAKYTTLKFFQHNINLTRCGGLELKDVREPQTFKYICYFNGTVSKPAKYKKSGHPFEKSHATTPIHQIDGLSSLAYRIVKAELRQLMTCIEIDIHSQD